MYKYTLIQIEQCPPSCGGNWEMGRYERVCFSNSPKRACAFEGPTADSHTGVDGCLIAECRRLERDGKVIFEVWD